MLRSSLPRRLIGKVGNQATLLRADPEQFARNLMHLTHPTLAEHRLVDVLNAAPMHVSVTQAAGPPRLNILDAAWTSQSMTGGPNTVLNLAFRVAKLGIPIRLVSTIKPVVLDREWLVQHATALTGLTELPHAIVATAADADNPLQLNPSDLFLATHWTTAQQLKSILPQMSVHQFFYMLQEFEPAFYAWSSNYALALETFNLDFWPIINEDLLAQYLLALPFGRLSEPATRERAVVFEPAVEAKLFYPPPPPGPTRPKRLLFYARPTNTRNMFGLGLMALRQVASDAALKDWEFMSIGSRGSVPELDLGSGHVLRRAPWMDYKGYADYLRTADILLCPMLSPHTSYPVLEMVACGGFSVTNIFATKTQSALRQLSANIIAGPATLAGFAEGLMEAIGRVNREGRATPSLNMARNWTETLQPAAIRVASICDALTGSALTTRT